MGKATGFLEFPRATAPKRDVLERVNDWFEVYQPTPKETVVQQAARCMDCGVPFCHTGCPVNNYIPDWNDLVYRDRWRDAIRMLHATNNFPEWTGRICPAPCEESCVLAINEPAVSIKLVEKNIVERAWEEGWIIPEPPTQETGKRVAIIGSGPAGLAAAQQLRRVGHTVVVFEKTDRLGGLLRYGIPDFKMEKWTIDRRLEQMRAEGVEFRLNTAVGETVPLDEIRREFDAILLAVGAEAPRGLGIPGDDLKGVVNAMDFLTQSNKKIAGDEVRDQILATGKNVVIIGGGDTGADCLGTCHRQKAATVAQFQIHPSPPEERADHTPWPMWGHKLRYETSHEEGGDREWSTLTLQLTGDEHGALKQLHGVRVGPRPELRHVPESNFVMDVDLVLVAIGFSGPVKRGIIGELGVELTPRGNVKVNESFATSVPGVFCAGDAQRGQSLVVWAIAEGRKAARGMDEYLMGRSGLPG